MGAKARQAPRAQSPAARAARHEFSPDGIDGARRLRYVITLHADTRLPTGAVDATVLSPPFNLQAEKAGFKDLLWLGERLELPLAGLGVRDETIQKNPKQILGMIRAIFRALAFAKAHPEETMRMLVGWAKVDQEVAAKSYDLGKRSWSESGVVSDAAVKVVVDQSMLELKAKDAVPLDRVRNWSFAEQARRDLGAAMAR